ncbi:hypothetical protein SEPCBS119000_006783, partial [Sporothrix epigloea]
MATKPRKTIKALDDEAAELRKQVGDLEELIGKLLQRLDVVDKRLKEAEAAPRTYAEVVASKRPVNKVLLSPERGHRVLIKIGDITSAGVGIIKKRTREDTREVLEQQLGKEA